MNNLKFDGVFEEIKERYPNIDLTKFLQQKLQLPDYKAAELAARIEKQFFPKETNETERKFVRTFLQKTDKAQGPPKTSAYSVDCLSGKEFELFIGWLLEELGHEVHSEKHPTYLGVNLVASKDGEMIAIHARRYPKTCVVSDSIVLMSKEAMRICGCQRSIVLITAYFTQQAMEQAQRLSVELWDRDTLTRKIDEVRKKVNAKAKSRFPQFSGSLVQTLLKFEETADFIIEPRPGQKYDLHLTGIKFPLLTFQAHDNEVTRCIYRIKNNKPVGEHEGITLISSGRDNERFGPNETQAYALILQYLETFLT
jgi:HJR/Mrr/RecB family endonuclease